MLDPWAQTAGPPPKFARTDQSELFFRERGKQMADKSNEKSAPKPEKLNEAKEIRKDYDEQAPSKKPNDVTPTFQAPDPPVKPKK